jgi:hypothetical protein
LVSFNVARSVLQPKEALKKAHAAVGRQVEQVKSWGESAKRGEERKEAYFRSLIKRRCAFFTLVFFLIFLTWRRSARSHRAAQ